MILLISGNSLILSSLIIRVPQLAYIFKYASLCFLLIMLIYHVIHINSLNEHFRNKLQDLFSSHTLNKLQFSWWGLLTLLLSIGLLVNLYWIIPYILYIIFAWWFLLSKRSVPVSDPVSVPQSTSIPYQVRESDSGTSTARNITITQSLITEMTEEIIQQRLLFEQLQEQLSRRTLLGSIKKGTETLLSYSHFGKIILQALYDS